MHPLFEKASKLTETIIGSAVEVHRTKGPGLIESIYEWCLLKELELRGLSRMRQKVVVVETGDSPATNRFDSTCWWKHACSLRVRRWSRLCLSTRHSS
ncbi:MAG: hypothetical protein K0Q64_53 [Nitrobacter vulgaris]|nr:hypothetical protein [Nitrobacter vulgaris]